MSHWFLNTSLDTGITVTLSVLCFLKIIYIFHKYHFFLRISSDCKSDKMIQTEIYKIQLCKLTIIARRNNNKLNFHKKKRNILILLALFLSQIKESIDCQRWMLKSCEKQKE